jgi:hypothetical protein
VLAVSIIRTISKPRARNRFGIQEPLEAASTSETSVNFYQTTQRYNPEDSHLHTFIQMTNVSTVAISPLRNDEVNATLKQNTGSHLQGMGKPILFYLFMVYLTTLSVAQTIQRRMIG